MVGKGIQRIRGWTILRANATKDQRYDTPDRIDYTGSKSLFQAWWLNCEFLMLGWALGFNPRNHVHWHIDCFLFQYQLDPNQEKLKMVSNISKHTDQNNLFRALCFGSTIFALAILTHTANGQHVAPNLIRQHTESLKCAADVMKDEIKAHLRGVRGYGKMIGANAVVKSRASSINRRIKRDPCYRGLDRDIEKLNDAICKLSREYAEILKCRPDLAACTCHIASQLDKMNRLVDCINSGHPSGSSFVLGPIIEVQHPVVAPGLTLEHGLHHRGHSGHSILDR
jgi:hypothetical protein